MIRLSHIWKLWLTGCLTLAIVMGSPIRGVAQQVQLKAKIDTTAITIGEQFRLELEGTYPAGVQFNWPAVPDTFQGFEVVTRSSIDTVKGAAGSIVRKQQFVITSFDSGYKVIPPISAVYFQGTSDSLKAETEPLLMHVVTVPVDTTKAIRDIKDLVRYPYTWQDALPWVFGGLLLVLIGWLVYYFIKRRQNAPVVIPTAPPIPPHEKALAALKQIEEEKLWQQGNYKQYHTRVTDVIRVYLEDTRKVNAPEMTTHEILSLSVIRSMSDSQYSSVKHLLELADLVKFAKVHPLPADNEHSMMLAVRFITEDQFMLNPLKTQPV